MKFDHYATFRSESGLSLFCDSFPGWGENELVFTECEKGTDLEGSFWTQYFQSSERLDHKKCRELFDIKGCIDAKFNMVMDSEDSLYNPEGDNFLEEVEA